MEQKCDSKNHYSTDHGDRTAVEYISKNTRLATFGSRELGPSSSALQATGRTWKVSLFLQKNGFYDDNNGSHSMDSDGSKQGHPRPTSDLPRGNAGAPEANRRSEPGNKCNCSSAADGKPLERSRRMRCRTDQGIQSGTSAWISHGHQRPSNDKRHSHHGRLRIVAQLCPSRGFSACGSDPSSGSNRDWKGLKKKKSPLSVLKIIITVC